MKRPEIEGLDLQPCCHDRLKEIDRKLKLGRLLHTMLAATPFALMLSRRPPIVGYSVASTDWDAWRQALKGVGPFVKSRCGLIAEMHALDHGGDPKLGEFWEAMADHFYN